MTIHLIPLDQIDPNPFQTRDGEDPEHVARLVESIAKTGLRDEPLARHVKETQRYQLAYGHSRLAAFKLLDADEKRIGYDAIPLKLREISDLGMFELAVRENSERKDLTPIEEARAMKRYRDEFLKNSREIGELFGLAQSTVRNKMRLLDLPEAVQTQVGARVITEGAARTLLTVQKIAPEEVEDLAGKIAEGGLENPEAVGETARRTLGNSEGTREMHSQWQSGDPRGGVGLWPLVWVAQDRQSITASQFGKAYPGWAETDKLAAKLRQVHLVLESGDLDDRNWEEVAMAYDVLPGFVKDAAQMIGPPACTSCDYYARLDGTHYCGMKACWAAKKKSWIAYQVNQKSEKMGIPVYDKKTDGRDYEQCERWPSELAERFQGYLDEKADHLRLRPIYQEYYEHPITLGRCVQLISVREEIAQAAEEKRREAAKQKERGITEKEQREIQKKTKDSSLAFLRNSAGPVFGQALDGLKYGVLEALFNSRFDQYWQDRQDIPEEKTARRQCYQELLAIDATEVDEDWEMLRKGAVEVAMHLSGVAEAWGVELPEGWLAMAAAFETEGVSTETEVDDG